VAPVYPATAKMSRQEGAVEIELLIGPTGAVEDTKLMKPVLLFNDAAVDAVRQWKYSPTIINGTAVSVRMLVRVTFALH
jgi:protein TonB